MAFIPFDDVPRGRFLSRMAGPCIGALLILGLCVNNFTQAFPQLFRGVFHPPEICQTPKPSQNQQPEAPSLDQVERLPPVQLPAEPPAQAQDMPSEFQSRQCQEYNDGLTEAAIWAGTPLAILALLLYLGLHHLSRTYKKVRIFRTFL